MNFVLDIDHGFNTTHNMDLKYPLIIVSDNSKYEPMIRIEKPPVEK